MRNDSLPQLSNAPSRPQQSVTNDVPAFADPLSSDVWERDSFPPYIFSVHDVPSFIRNDTVFQYVLLCKTLRVLKVIRITRASELADSSEIATVAKVSFLTVHGNIQYDYAYQSFVDIPYYQRELRQHTLRTTLQLLYKDTYPLTLTFSTRQSNSPYFVNFLDMGLQFNKADFERRAKKELMKKVEGRLWQTPKLVSLEDSLKVINEKVNNLRTFIQNPSVLQKLIEEREADYYRKLRVKEDSINTSMGITAPRQHDPFYPRFVKGQHQVKFSSDVEEYQGYIREQKHALDSLEQKALILQRKAERVCDSIRKQIAAIQQKLNKARSLDEARAVALNSEVVLEKRTKAERVLANVRSIGLGRSMLNFSELTVWNVSLTGVSTEYTPGKFYTAFAAGKIDYGFRDFLGRNARRQGQQLAIVRFGIGDIEKRALILSVFTGRKYNYAHSISDTVSDQIPVTGFALQGILKHNEFTSLCAEIAKTSSPASGALAGRQSTSSLFNFSDRSNLGISIKAQTYLKATGTRLSAFARQSGENFQSFALFTYQTNQSAWNLRVEQSLFNDKISVAAALRRNDFTNPFTEKSFRTSTVFKSVQLTVRYPKWPVISIGYNPGSQLYLIDDKRIREDAYYITNASAIYPYFIGDVRMISSFVFNDFSSRGTDSGFIAYSGKNYIASQQFLFDLGSLQSSYAYTDQAPIKFYSFEAGGDVAIGKILKMNAGAKYHYVPLGQRCWGGRAGLLLDAKRLGSLQFQYEKYYLPTTQNTLFPIETGRLTWLKSF